MKTIDLGQIHVSVEELLNSARDESVVVRSADGATFMLSGADEFTTEVELLRRHHGFLKLLDTWKQDRRAVSLDEAEKRLRVG